MKSFFKGFIKGFGILLFSVIMGCCLGCVTQLWASSKADLSKPVIVSVLVASSKADFENKYSGILKEQIRGCSICQIQNITPYDAEGNFQASQAATQIETAGSSSSILFLNWNEKMSAEVQPVVAALKKQVEAGVVVVAAAGLARLEEPTLALSRTFVGQVPGVVIIGELGERERLLTQSYFGPEMLTALKPPREFVGQGYGPVFFAARLATNWNRKTSAEWVTHFKMTKSKVRRLWPGLEDFFGRN